MKKLRGFATKKSYRQWLWFTYFCHVSWKSVKWKWPNRCVVFMTKNLRKKLVFVPCLRILWTGLVENFSGPLFPHLCQVLSESVQFPRRYTRKKISKQLQYRREAYLGFSPTVNYSVSSISADSLVIKFRRGVSSCRWRPLYSSHCKSRISR